jgi:hypothetical protein
VIFNMGPNRLVCPKYTCLRSAVPSSSPSPALFKGSPLWGSPTRLLVVRATFFIAASSSTAFVQCTLSPTGRGGGSRAQLCQASLEDRVARSPRLFNSLYNWQEPNTHKVAGVAHSLQLLHMLVFWRTALEGLL